MMHSLKISSENGKEVSVGCDLLTLYQPAGLFLYLAFCF